MVAAPVTKTDQKKQKDWYSKNIFVEISWRKETEVLIKFNGRGFWSWTIINLKLWKTKLEKRSSCPFCFVTAPGCFLEKLIKQNIKDLKSILRTVTLAKNKRS